MKTQSAIAANRFGLGARPGDLGDIDRSPQRWLLDQLSGPSRTVAALRDLPLSSEVLDVVNDMRRGRRDANNNQAERATTRKATIQRYYVEQTMARYRAAIASNYPFYERLVHFWSNHFAVSADKPPIAAVAGLFENEAVRPHVTGKFRDLLIAVERHPAMILYLDNQRSIGPNSVFGKRANTRRRDRTFGLNENLAREILELHTLGVDGGYTQHDVSAFAAVISGWSVGGVAARGGVADGEPSTFEFREAIHEPGDHRLLGTTYRQSGVAQGLAVLGDLATHPSTARHIATKLARHFVADEPPAELVEQLARAWLDSDGDLAVLYRTLIESADPWRDMLPKYKTPHDLLISAFRALGRIPDKTWLVVSALETMGQAPFRSGSPAGWPDTAEQWGGADALYKRIEWSDGVAHRQSSGVHPVLLGEAVLGPALSPRTREAILGAESRTQGVTLLLASPDFQRR